MTSKNDLYKCKNCLGIDIIKSTPPFILNGTCNALKKLKLSKHLCHYGITSQNFIFESNLGSERTNIFWSNVKKLKIDGDVAKLKSKYQEKHINKPQSKGDTPEYLMPCNDINKLPHSEAPLFTAFSLFECVIKIYTAMNPNKREIFESVMKKYSGLTELKAREIKKTLQDSLRKKGSTESKIEEILPKVFIKQLVSNTVNGTNDENKAKLILYIIHHRDLIPSPIPERAYAGVDQKSLKKAKLSELFKELLDHLSCSSKSNKDYVVALKYSRKLKGNVYFPTFLEMHDSMVYIPYNRLLYQIKQKDGEQEQGRPVLSKSGHKFFEVIHYQLAREVTKKHFENGDIEFEIIPWGKAQGGITSQMTATELENYRSNYKKRHYNVNDINGKAIIDFERKDINNLIKWCNEIKKYP